MPVARRPVAAPVAAPAPPPSSGLLSLGFYTGSFTLPEGDYAMTFETLIHQGTKQDGTPVGPARLGVMITAYPITRTGQLVTAEPVTQFLSMGTKAKESWAPSDGGKNIAPIPGGLGGSLNNKTNWFMFLKSLYDSGMPEGVGSTLADLDGVWVHTTQVLEPEDRKGFGAGTGEVEQEQSGPKKIPVVAEILDGGKPWEGTGGIPALAAAPTTHAAPVAPAQARRVVQTAAVAAPVAAPEGDDEDLKVAATNAIADVLTQDAYSNGIKKLLLRTNVFKVLGEKDPAMAQRVSNEVFGNEAVVAAILGSLGYHVVGADVKPQ